MMDDEELEAMRLKCAQEGRWVRAGETIEFWSRPDEQEISMQIVRLQKMSASYQRKYGQDYPFRITNTKEE